MSLPSVNLLAVLVAGFSSLVVGFVYYSGPLLQNPWLEEIGRTVEEAAQVPPTHFLLSFLLALVEAYVLAVLIATMGSTGVVAGILSGLLVWAGFVAPTSGANALFGGRTLRLWLIQNGNHLITLVVMGVILALWQ